MLGCLAVTVLVLVAVRSLPPMYSSRMEVVLLPPEDTISNPYVSKTASTVAFAGSVERAVNGRGNGSRASSDTVTLVGTGVRDGTSIWIPNSGGQWSYGFNEPVVHVEVVAGTPESAALRMRAALAQVLSAIDRLQNEQGVPVDVRVRTQLSPPTAEVVVRAGSETRAVAGVLAVGILATLLLLSRGTDLPRRGIATRRRARRTASP